MAAPRPIRRLATAGAALVLAASLLLGLAPSPAGAVVTPLHGYRATVDGFTSWYGSYGMAGLGTAWCIDHGIRAPDPAYAYRAADLSAVSDPHPHGDGLDARALRRRHRPCAPRGVMLVLHDLMGATYPSGRLDVDRLTVTRLAGLRGRRGAGAGAGTRLKADGRPPRPPPRAAHPDTSASAHSTPDAPHPSP